MYPSLRVGYINRSKDQSYIHGNIDYCTRHSLVRAQYNGNECVLDTRTSNNRFRNNKYYNALKFADLQKHYYFLKHKYVFVSRTLQLNP